MPIFCCPAISTRPIIYSVERVRDGGSFTTRRVTATQHGRAMFVMSVVVSQVRAGTRPPERHAGRAAARGPAERAGPEGASMLDRSAGEHAQLLGAERPIEMRPVDVSRYFAREKRAPEQMVWMRASGRLPDALPLHQCVLAYASDFSLLDTALIAHGKLMFDKDMQLASLDHALWFHRPFRADEWLLYAQDSPSSHGARGFCRGSIFTRDGVPGGLGCPGRLDARSAHRPYVPQTNRHIGINAMKLLGTADGLGRQAVL